jgi:hypothetical protein
VQAKKKKKKNNRANANDNHYHLGAVMRLIIIRIAGGPPHVQLWENSENAKGALKKLS